MADSPVYFVYHGDPAASILPRRPSVDDAGGENKTDDAESPPDAETMPTGAGHNQVSRLLAAHSKLIGSHGFSVTFPAGDPGLTKFSALDDTLEASDITPTDNGDGDTTFTWAAGTFPAQQLRVASLTLNEDIAALAPCAVVGVNSVRVTTRNAASTLTDIAFTIILSGQ